MTEKKEAAINRTKQNAYFNRFVRTNPPLYRNPNRKWTGMPDGILYARQVRMAVIDNQIIEALPGTRRQLAEKTGLTYATVCGHVTLLKEDEILAEAGDGILSLHPLEA